MQPQREICLQNQAQPIPEKPSILIVDDDRDTCDMMCVFLSQQYECDAAYGGEEALTRIRAKEYSLILADLMMPHVDGYAIISTVTSLAPTTPVIVVSGIAGVQNAVKAMKMGAFDFITKPFDPEHVDMSVKRALSHHFVAQAAQHYERQLAAYAAELEKTNVELTKALKELDSAYHSVISALATALETRNVETRGHSDRVAAYSLRLARELGLDEAEMKALELGALFHDIGKIGIEDRILLKPMHLTKEEWVEMRKHPEKGARILEGIQYLRAAMPVVTQHHERWDGKGYPAGLAGEDIDLKARIFSVADAVDAITSDRPYDKPRPFEDAKKELERGAGKQFDPKVVEAFCRVSMEEWKSLAEAVNNVQ